MLAGCSLLVGTLAYCSLALGRRPDLGPTADHNPVAAVPDPTAGRNLAAAGHSPVADRIPAVDSLDPVRGSPSKLAVAAVGTADQPIPYLDQPTAVAAVARSGQPNHLGGSRLVAGMRCQGELDSV